MKISHVRIARWAAIFGRLAWWSLVIGALLVAAFKAGTRSAEKSTYVPSATTTIHGGHTYVGPIYVSDWKIDEKTGKLVRWRNPP